jgi:hypothetical protein
MDNLNSQQTDQKNDKGERKIQKIVLPGQTPEGQYVLSVLLKRSYDILSGERCKRAESDQKLFPGDVHYGDPMNSTVKFESDFIPYKIATDIALNGKAYVPNEGSAQSLTASLIVGSFRKDILVIGDRVCHHRLLFGTEFTDPKPFTTMEIRYERAYGGVDIHSDPNVPCMYPRNHLGRGFVIGKSKSVIDNLALPNIEDPNDLLTPDRISTGHFMNWERQPIPQGFGWFSKCWQPRASLAGVMPADRPVEQELRKAYALVVPPEQRDLYEQTQLPDMDFRFFNGASLGLSLPFLSGNEEIRAINLAPEGEIFFQLPGERPKIGLDIGTGVQEPEVFLHTVMIRMEDRQVDLVWRGAVPYPGPDWLTDMKKMDVLID